MSVPFADMRRRLGSAQADPAADGVPRREFLKLLAASLALAGADGCTRMPASNIHPYVNQPELTPGVPQYYATSMVLDGFATGLLVESHEGRPTKVEGNPEHPASLGAAGVLEQASVLQLYDPDRARQNRRDGQVSAWNELAATLAPEAISRRLGAGGAGLSLLLPPTSSPLERGLLDRIAQRYPAARVYFHSPLTPALPALLPQYRIADADVLLFVDADSLASGPFHLRHAREFAGRRRPDGSRGMNRVYALESSVSVSGMAADHRRAVPPRQLLPLMERLATLIDSDRPSNQPADPWIDALASDLRAHSGRALVIPGHFAPLPVQALAWRINRQLGNVGRTVWFTASPLAGAGDTHRSLAALADALRANEVDTLICAGVNASYATAGLHDIGALLARVPQSVYLGAYEDETARRCQWMVPAAHYLESWGDACAYDGSLSIVQPLIESLWGGRTTADLLSLLLGEGDVTPYDRLRESWRARGVLGTGSSFEDGWRELLRHGVLPGSEAPRQSSIPAEVAAPSQTSAAPFDLVFRPHTRVHDGAFANNAWLQELPQAVTTLTWNNAAQLSPATADRLQVKPGDLLQIDVAGRSVAVPALPTAGHADDTVTVTFGGGREGSESVARGVGTNVYPVWPGDRFVVDALVSRASAAPRTLAITQPHHSLDTTTPVRTIAVDAPGRVIAASPTSLPLYRAPSSLPDGVNRIQWAMTIDLAACIGCGACTAACQAENNVPVVGVEQVQRGREMHWLRIDWYAERDGEAASVPQPMLCQHCENAPCEYVCPVEATVHGRDGLNEMVYNRCVGTRFCSNNCPYKVRRFNWFDFNAGVDATVALVHNPDVTVRERGVMEKCTFCVQRIREAEISARADGRPLRGTDVRTACQQACPAQAIQFGSLDERDSAMVRDRESDRAYAVLSELGTEPRVRYLARVRNPNRELEPRP